MIRRLKGYRALNRRSGAFTVKWTISTSSQVLVVRSNDQRSVRDVGISVVVVDSAGDLVRELVHVGQYRATLRLMSRVTK